MITSNIRNIIGFKKSYYLFVITGLILLFVVSLTPQKASAQAFVPVKDAELNAAFKLFLESAVGSAGGGTYVVDGNPVEIAAEICETRTEPVVADKRSMFGYYDLNNDGDDDDPDDRYEHGVYKYEYVFQDKDLNGVEDGVEEWVLYPIIHRAEIDMRWDNPWRTDNTETSDGLEMIGPVNPGTLEIKDPLSGAMTQKGYYTNPANPYFFLPSLDDLTDAEVNNSTSLNCLLQEMVEWEKLQINMQMHSMVKEYFTDAQTYMLSQQLLTTLAAATIEWSNKELEQRIYIDGVATTTKGSIYPGNIYQEGQGVMSKEVAGILAQMEEAVDVEGLGLDPLEIAYLKEQLEKNTRSAIESRDAADTRLKNAVKSTAPPAGNSAEDAYVHAMRNSALNVTNLLESAVGQRMTQAADNQRAQWEAYGGYLSVLDCGKPRDAWYDPYCRTPRLETPGNILSKNLDEATRVGTEALRTADEIGEGTDTSSQELTYQLQQRSLRDYEIKELLNNQQTPQELFNEFEQVLVGYYGLGTSTTYWSRNMLVNTWDDIMWGSGAPWKAEALGKRLDEIIVEVEKYGTP